ncbi:uncharacterized protein J3D65DRAFT_427162 [Phyllosticta citribraziliensis]|uniref:Uncharacterized protein n=1 Tax=Phyllosticta citribraziliensis TaxID=989973 RepID=A0ABR1LI57_9PEZI
MKIAELQQAHARALQEIKDSIVALGMSLEEAHRSSSRPLQRPATSPRRPLRNPATSTPRPPATRASRRPLRSPPATSTPRPLARPATRASRRPLRSPATRASRRPLKRPAPTACRPLERPGTRAHRPLQRSARRSPRYLSIKPAPKRKAVEVISLSDDDDQPSLVNPRSQDLKYGTARRRTQLRKVMEAASKFALPFAAPSSSSSAPTFKHPSFLVGGGATTAERLSQMIRPETAFPGFPNVTESRTNWIVTTRHTLTNMGVRKSDLVVNLEAVKYYLMPAYETDRRAHEIYDRYMDPHTAPGKVTGGWAWAPIKELLLMLEEMPESLDCNDLHELLAFFKYRFPKTLSGKLK